MATNGNGGSRSSKGPRPVDDSINMGTLRVAMMMTRDVLGAYLGKSFHGARQLYQVLGYDTTVTVGKYLASYRRTGLGKRIINAPADATWRRPPEVTEDKNDATESEFESAFEALARRLRLWSRLNRADRLTGIGHYGVIVIGTKGTMLKDPIEPESLDGQEGVLYLACY